MIKGGKEYIYKSVDGIDLKLWVFSPAETKNKTLPAMLFFFGGGWYGGSPMSFVGQSQYLAERGMYGVVADYRVKSRNGVTAKYCVEDARDALRYLKNNAAKMGTDFDRIGVGGGSAGGHLAACLGTLHIDDSTAPNAMALYNPATVLAVLPEDTSPQIILPKVLEAVNKELESRTGEMRNRLGVSPEMLSPIHHVAKDSPPTLILHGMKDKVVPYITAELFSKKLAMEGVRVELKNFKDAGHGFFNREPYRSQTNAELGSFLTSLGWLQ
jgi:acetyl esterase/lipase